MDKIVGNFKVVLLSASSTKGLISKVSQFYRHFALESRQ